MCGGFRRAPEPCHHRQVTDARPLLGRAGRANVGWGRGRAARLTAAAASALTRRQRCGYRDGSPPPRRRPGARASNYCLTSALKSQPVNRSRSKILSKLLRTVGPPAATVTGAASLALPGSGNRDRDRGRLNFEGPGRCQALPVPNLKSGLILPGWSNSKVRFELDSVKRCRRVTESRLVTVVRPANLKPRGPRLPGSPAAAMSSLVTQ